jgi:outer membrane receptor for ferrienterochelin and colicins
MTKLRFARNDVDRQNVWRRCVCVWLGVILSLCGAHAQDANVRDLTSLEIEDLAKARLSTASRHLDDPRKAPAAVTVINHEEIVRYGWRTLADLLRSVTGIHTAYDRTYSYVGVRGFLQSGDYNARVLLLIDGHRLNDNIYDSALIGTEFPLDLDLIDRVEIVRGPGSSLYGTDAELAVINVLTRRPDNQSTVELSSQSQSFLGRTGRFSMSTHAMGTAMLLSGSMYRSSGVPKLFFPEYDTPDSNNGIADHLDGDRFGHAFAALTRGQLRVEAMYGSRKKIVPNASYATNFNDPDNRATDTRAYVDASYSHEFSADTQLDLRAYYDAYRFRASYPYGGTNSPDRSVQINDAAADWIGIEAIVGRRLGRNRVVGGVNGEYNLRVNQRNYYVNQPPFLNDNRQLTLAAIFGKAEINPSSKFSVNLGGRADWFSKFGNGLSPRVALTYLPSASTSVKYVFNRAFRTPDPYDEFYVDNLDASETSRSLQTERIQTHSVIAEHSFNQWLRGMAVGFDNDLLRAISEANDPITGATLIKNGIGDQGHGLELEMIANPGDGWSGRASYSLLRTRKKGSNSKVANSPSGLGKLNATIPATDHGLLGVELLYTGPQPNYLGQSIPFSFLTNVTISTRFRRSGWSGSASCYNLFDRRLATPTGPEVLPAATTQDGRTWRVTIGYKWHFETARSRP